jgi:glycosyltransferase involved in cell wall biosynthesis
VSRHTQRAFRAAFPGHAAPREFVFYPAIRAKLMRDAERLAPPARAARSSGFDLQAAGLPVVQVAMRDECERKPAGKKSKRAAPNRAAPRGFDPALPYFITATSEEPRKNIQAIVRAFRQWLRGRANAVILGDVDSRRYCPDPEANVYFPGYVSDAEKIAFFGAARGMVFPSLSEGFGIPIVEGAVLGLPVLCSDIEVFREVAGDNAFYFDPASPASLARAVEQALGDCELAKARAEALRRSALARFSQAAVGVNVQIALAELGLAR